jgi:hypothetical protein
MNDTRSLLERAARTTPAPTPDIGQIYERRSTKARRRRVSAAAVAILVAVGGSSLALNAIGGTRPGLGAAAGNEIGAPTQDITLRPGEYYYQRFDGGWGVCESWWALDDSGRLDNAPGGGNCWGPEAGIYQPGDFFSDSGPVAGLSTDPSVLMSQLRNRVQPDGASPEPYADWGGPIEWGLIRSLGELLEAPDVTPEQKAAMLVVAAELSSSVDMKARDAQGRPAILLTLDSENETHRWFFDPQSHQPLDIDGYVMQAAGVVSGTNSLDLTRSFVPEIWPPSGA